MGRLTLERLARGAPTPIRVGVALALVVPAGFFMGMPFPLAMTLALRRGDALGAWLWAVNGAASVCASVLAVVIASAWGISAAWWTGVACYVVAGGLLAIGRPPVGSSESATGGRREAIVLADQGRVIVSSEREKSKG